MYLKNNTTKYCLQIRLSPKAHNFKDILIQMYFWFVFLSRVFETYFSFNSCNTGASSHSFFTEVKTYGDSYYFLFLSYLIDD